VKTGDQVQAVKQIDEHGENGETIVHARAGDVGQVVDVFSAGWLMIAWAGGACQCHTDEITPFVEASTDSPV
jgi:hypothetical protein